MRTPPRSKVSRSAGARHVTRRGLPAPAILASGINGAAMDQVAAETAARGEFTIVAPTGLTLNQTLAAIGWRSEPGNHRGKRIFCAAGHDLGVMYAGDVWDELRARGLCSEPRGYERDVPYEPRGCACTEGSAS